MINHTANGMKTFPSPHGDWINKKFEKHYGLGEDPANIPDEPDEGRESYLLSRCMLLCRDKRLPAFHDYSRKKNRAGWGDIFIWLPKGHTLLVELKSARGRLSPEQTKLRRDLGGHGHVVYVGRSYGWFKELLERKLEEAKKG